MDLGWVGDVVVALLLCVVIVLVFTVAIEALTEPPDSNT